MRAAEIVGLPLTEQTLFAEALIQQYPTLASRHWLGRDPTPRDNNRSVQTSDFNHLLLRQYLNERPGAGRRTISLQQLRAVNSRVSEEHTLDEVTRTELGRWRQDFLYRGGELFTGTAAPISRTGLVPALQAPAAQTDITWIPRIMRSKGWNEGATLMEEWFRRSGRERPATIEATPNDFGPPVIGVIKMDWVLKFPRAKSLYDQLMNGMWKTREAKLLIGSRLKKAGIVTRLKANQEQRIDFGDLTSANVLKIEEMYIQSLPLNEGWLNKRINYLFDNLDGLTAALAEFNMRMAIKGEVSLNAEGAQVTVREVGIYIKDSYDFLKEQPLGKWDDNKLKAVTNKDFRDWREQNGKGGDFLVYSDIKVTKLNPPQTFTVPI